MTARTFDDLRGTLERLDGCGYKAYRRLRGPWHHPDFELYVDRVQGDPFAPPSALRVRIPAAVARLPEQCLGSAARRIAVDEPGQQVLERTACTVERGDVSVRFTAGLPARGRRVAAAAAAEMFCAAVPRLVASVCATALDLAALERHCDTVEDARALREALRPAGLVAFVADGARLPRRSGIDDRPLAGAVSFRAPASLACELCAPHAGAVRGMGIPQGVTLIVGGGYHGKSTLLRALAAGVYDHVPGDGRERVVADPDAVTVRAEDGRSIAGADISAFIGPLPGDGDTRCFSTANASGSTSQAAAIVEAIESGARVLLVDEDTSASNFMVRDRRMQALVPRRDEPITPFVDRVRELHERHALSTVLVMGGSGDYLDVADTVIAMRGFQPEDVTLRARQIAARIATGRVAEIPAPLAPPRPRRVLAASIDPRRGRRAVAVSVTDRARIRFGSSDLDLRALQQLVHPSQTRAIAAALLWCRDNAFARGLTVTEALDLLAGQLARAGLALLGGERGDLAAFRRHELAAALSRLRTLRATPM